MPSASINSTMARQSQERKNFGLGPAQRGDQLHGGVSDAVALGRVEYKGNLHADPAQRGAVTSDPRASDGAASPGRTRLATGSPVGP
jgi:hypothetical protein